jgi:hypothetical protein
MGKIESILVSTILENKYKRTSQTLESPSSFIYFIEVNGTLTTSWLFFQSDDYTVEKYGEETLVKSKNHAKVDDHLCALVG